MRSSTARRRSRLVEAVHEQGEDQRLSIPAAHQGAIHARDRERVDQDLAFGVVPEDDQQEVPGPGPVGSAGSRSPSRRRSTLGEAGDQERLRTLPILGTVDVEEEDVGFSVGFDRLQGNDSCLDVNQCRDHGSVASV